MKNMYRYMYMYAEKENNQHVEYSLVFNCTCSKMTLSYL